MLFLILAVIVGALTYKYGVKLFDLVVAHFEDKTPPTASAPVVAA